MDFFNENSSKTFAKNEEKEMQQFLKKKDSEAVWYKFELSLSQAKSLVEGPMYLYDKAKKLGVTNSEEAIASVGLIDIDDLSHMVLQTRLKDGDHKVWLMSNSARRDFTQRCGADCPLIWKVSIDEAFDFINDGVKSLNGKSALAKYEDEKVWAVHGPEYRILPPSKLFFEVQKAIAKSFKSTDFAGGTWTHEIVQASWVSNDDEIIESYKDLAFEKTGLLNYDQYQPVIMFSTSDVGDSTATVFAGITDGKRYINIGNPIKLKHAGTASIEKFADLLQGLYAKYKESIDSLKKLYDIPISYPVNCAVNIARDIGIPISAITKATENFCDVFESNTPQTASEVFFLLQEAIYIAETVKKENISKNLLCMKEAASRLLTGRFKWEDYDSPTIFQKKKKIR